MIDLSLTQIADIVGGECPTDTGIVVTGVSIDSRTTRAGDLFVPLPGEHDDGHTFIEGAMAAGAAGYLCLASSNSTREGAVLVDDPLDALTGLASWVRDEVDPFVIAITGSNGKTTTKDMTAAAVGVARVTVANPGSFNNEIGLPLTLCLLTADTEVLVCEIGSRGIGHIAQVMPILRPDVAVVTTIAEAHIGEFRSLDAIVQAKGELVEGLAEDGIAILNTDVPAMATISALAPGQVVTVGTDPAADLRPTAIEEDDTAVITMTVEGSRVRLPLPGRHQVTNGLLALAAARAAGVPIDVAAAGLADAFVSRWRMEVSRTDDGVRIVNDAYNANLGSMDAALHTTAAMHTTGKRWAVLGYMAELGDQTFSAHQAVGAIVADVALDGLVVVEARAGAIADGAREAGFRGTILAVADVEEAIDSLDDVVESGDVVLIKASRSVGLEVVADGLRWRRSAVPDGADDDSAHADGDAR